jgi:hypothetical protein
MNSTAWAARVLKPPRRTLKAAARAVGTITDQNLAVTALESRTRDDVMAARTTRLADPGGAGVQPAPPILVGERNAIVHLVDVGSRMEPIGVLELPSQAQSEKRSHGRLPASRNAHHDHNPRTWRRSVFLGLGLHGHHFGHLGAASRSVNQWRRPTGQIAAAGIVRSPAWARATTPCLSFPVTRNATSRLLSSAG